MVIRIELLGAMTIRLGDAPPLPLGGRCARLLAYVALGRGRQVSRCELLERVWADRGDRVNPGSFNTALWRLRRLLGRASPRCDDVLVCDAGNAVGFNPALPVWLDVQEFERLTVSALAAPCADLGQRQCDDLRAGVALYTADLLLDYSDDWVLREREKQRRTYLNALGRLMELASLRGEHGEAIRQAQAILDCEPLREDVHRALMRAFVAAGQRALALRQYEQCRALLRQELAIQPMPDTVALYRQIADSAVSSFTAMAPAAPPACGAPVAVCRDGDRVPLPAAMPLPMPELDACLERARQHLQCADRQLQQGLARIRD